MSDAVEKARVALREAMKNLAASEQLVSAQLVLRESLIEYHEATGKTFEEAVIIYEQARMTFLKHLEKCQANLAIAREMVAEIEPNPTQYKD